jgi:hypothetical protein
LPGDCGDEYRRLPFLTAAGDLGDHMKNIDPSERVREAIVKGQHVEYSSGSRWEPITIGFHLYLVC